MSRLRKLLRVACPSTRNTQQQDVQACREGAQHLHSAQHAELMREFESLLAIVCPANDTPEHEYPVIRQAATNDLPAAILSYRGMADKIRER